MAQGFWGSPAYAAYSAEARSIRSRMAMKERRRKEREEAALTRIVKRFGGKGWSRFSGSYGLPNGTDNAKYGAMQKALVRAKARFQAEWEADSKEKQALQSRAYAKWERKHKAGWKPTAQRAWRPTTDGDDEEFVDGEFRATIYFADRHSSAGWRLYKGRKEITYDLAGVWTSDHGWMNAEQARRAALKALELAKKGDS